MMLRTYTDLRRFTRELEAIADWRDELCSKIRRAQLRFELIGLDASDQEDLATEVEMFKQVCRCLSGVSRESIPEREAA